MVSQRRQNLVATLSMWSIFALSLVAILTSCSPEEAPPSTASFARTSATIVQPTNATYPINLIFVAEPDDAIWTHLTGIVLSDDFSLPPGGFTVVRGDGTNGVMLGNVTFTVDVPATVLSFRTVGLVFAGSSTITHVPVGGWSLRGAPADDFASADAGADVVGMPRCTTADFPVPEAVASVQRFDPGSPRIRLSLAPNYTRREPPCSSAKSPAPDTVQVTATQPYVVPGLVWWVDTYRGVPADERCAPPLSDTACPPKGGQKWLARPG